MHIGGCFERHGCHPRNVNTRYGQVRRPLITGVALEFPIRKTFRKLFTCRQTVFHNTLSTDPSALHLSELMSADSPNAQNSDIRNADAVRANAHLHARKNLHAQKLEMRRCSNFLHPLLPVPLLIHHCEPSYQQAK